MAPFKTSSGLTRRGVQALRDSTDSGIPAPEVRDSGLTAKGLRRMGGREEVEAKTLSTKQRKSLSGSSFVFPDKAPGPGSYPINDRSHAANALSRASGKPEFAAVKRKVCSRYPDLPECK